MVDDIPGTPITVRVDGFSFHGRYRQLSGNRLEVYTDRSDWVMFIGREAIEDLARDMLRRIAHKERLS